jgi:hypothetical protein
MASDQRVFLGTKYMSGFLVVPDGDPLPVKVPAIHLADFIKIIHLSNIEEYDSVVTPELIYQPPFAMVTAAQIKRRSGEMHLILPANVFSSLDDRPWIFRLAPGKYWHKVVDAEPLRQGP